MPLYIQVGEKRWVNLSQVVDVAILGPKHARLVTLFGYVHDVHGDAAEQIEWAMADIAMESDDTVAQADG